MTANRQPTGIAVLPVAVPDTLGYGTYYRHALATGTDGTLYLICDEGVGHPLTADEGRQCQPTGEMVDLASFVRVFGARLDSNVAQWVWKLNPPTMPECIGYRRDPHTAESVTDGQLCDRCDALLSLEVAVAQLHAQEEIIANISARFPRCECESVHHFPADDTLPLAFRDSPDAGTLHAYGLAFAGSRRAEWVGPICDDCADTHMASYVIADDDADED